MREPEQVLSLIGDIYDAALKPSLWGDVLCQARDFVGGSAAVLYAKDTTRTSANIYHDDGGIDPHYKRLYLDQYVETRSDLDRGVFRRHRAAGRDRRSHAVRRVH